MSFRGVPVPETGLPTGASTSFKYDTENKGLNAARVRCGATRWNAFGKISVPTPTPQVHSGLPHVPRVCSPGFCCSWCFEVR